MLLSRHLKNGVSINRDLGVYCLFTLMSDGVFSPTIVDVVTRKSGTDENSLGNKCGLLIIDEVHLLADERGAVIESVVSRLHRLVESRQRQTRIVALSATLPNYAGTCAQYIDSTSVFGGTSSSDHLFVSRAPQTSLNSYRYQKKGYSSSVVSTVQFLCSNSLLAL